MRKDKERFYKRAICNILLLSLIPTYKDEPSAHGRCELEARRSVHPERMQVGALTSIWQVGVPPAEAQGMDSANSLFYKKVRSNISHGFTYSILLSTTSQRLAVPLSLQDGKRLACFPSRQHTRINFPPDKLL